MAVQLIGGKQFSEAAAPLLWLALAYGLSAAGFYLRATIVTLIGPLFYLSISILGTFAFVPALYFGIHAFGMAGAGLSQVAFAVVWFSLSVGTLARRLKIKPQDLNDAFLQFLVLCYVRFKGY
jgi:O-antigen/teichoic acid export membrane protein